MTCLQKLIPVASFSVFPEKWCEKSTYLRIARGESNGGNDFKSILEG